jgi:conjugal transfer pilus assembly protein TraE
MDLNKEENVLKSLLQQSRLNHLIKQRNGYLVLSCGLLLLSLILIIFCFDLSHRERVVLVPPHIEHSFWVDNDGASSEYLSEMALFFCFLRLDVTPESADSQRQILLRYTDPHTFGVLNNALIAERDHIVAQHVSTAFYPISVKVNAKSFVVIITGDLTSSVGATPLPVQRVAYQLQFRYEQGRLSVNQFQEVKPHD